MKEKVIRLVKSYKGEDIDLCFEIYQIISKCKDDDEAIDVLQTFFETIKTIPSDETHVIERHFTNEELVEFNSMYSSYINVFCNALIKKVISEKLSPRVFYKKIFEKINNDEIIDSDKAKAFAILRIAQMDFVPFRDMGEMLSMDNDTYRALLQDVSPYINSLKSILNMKLSQRTEEASLFLNVLDSVEEYPNKVVLLTVLLDMYTNQKLSGIMEVVENKVIKPE